MSEAAKAYDGQGYYIHSEPLLPPDLVQRARADICLLYTSPSPRDS